MDSGYWCNVVKRVEHNPSMSYHKRVVKKYPQLVGAWHRMHATLDVLWHAIWGSYLIICVHKEVGEASQNLSKLGHRLLVSWLKRPALNHIILYIYKNSSKQKISGDGRKRVKITIIT